MSGLTRVSIFQTKERDGRLMWDIMLLMACCTVSDMSHQVLKYSGVSGFLASLIGLLPSMALIVIQRPAAFGPAPSRGEWVGSKGASIRGGVGLPSGCRDRGCENVKLTSICLNFIPNFPPILDYSKSEKGFDQWQFVTALTAEKDYWILGWVGTWTDPYL